MNNLTRLEKTLQDLVAIRSATGLISESRLVLDYIKKIIEPYPLFVSEFEDSSYPILYASTRKNMQTKCLFIAHVDVVPASKELFNMQFDDHKLIGRGVWDMKFAIAGYLELIREIGNSIKEFDIAFLFTSDEETRNKNIEFMFEKGIKPECTVLLDGSSDWCVEKHAKGAWTIEIEVAGKASHGARPWEGVSASMLLLDILNKIRNLFNNSKYSDTLNISMIKAGEAINQLPESASAILDMRFMSNENEKKIRIEIEKLQKIFNFIINEKVHINPIFQDVNSIEFKLYKSCVNNIVGSIGKDQISFGASEASKIVERNIPCIISRPIGGGHHSDFEWIDRKSFSMMVPVFKEFIKLLHAN